MQSNRASGRERVSAGLSRRSLAKAEVRDNRSNEKSCGSIHGSRMPPRCTPARLCRRPAAAARVARPIIEFAGTSLPFGPLPRRIRSAEFHCPTPEAVYLIQRLFAGNHPGPCNPASVHLVNHEESNLTRSLGKGPADLFVVNNDVSYDCPAHLCRVQIRFLKTRCETFTQLRRSARQQL